MDFVQKRNLDRLGNILVYFAKNTDVCGVTKANKLLYYLDCHHLLKYGRKVTSDIYKKRPEGPVPEDAYNRIDSIAKSKELDAPDDFKEYLANYIDVEVKCIEYPNKTYDFFEIVPKTEFNPKLFSKSELEILEEIASLYKTATAKGLSEQTHRELPWKSAEEYKEIDLKLFLKGKLSQEEIDQIAHIEKEIESIQLNYQ